MMGKIVLFTKDESLRKELSEVLPKGFKASPPATTEKNAFIFFDIDTMKPGQIRELHEKNLVIAVTKQKRTEPVMEAATFGAYEALQRPLKEEAVLTLLNELRDFTEEIKDNVPIAGLPPTPTCAIVGNSPIIMDVCKKLARLSQVDAPVLITGETGTGKELIAESIAQLSSRFGKPFVVVNCAAVPETLLESELFGFEKGSFTGAIATKEGMLKIADEGCVFFDEVGELPLSLQGKLLRFLQTQSFYPIGSTKEVHVDVRVISATNRDLSAMVREKKFREDLYHRLRVTAIHIPPLRERKKDILPLVHFFINRYHHTAPRPIKGITKEYFKKLLSYDWPGNIRELENIIRSSIALSKTNYVTTHELKELGSRSSPAKKTTLSETFASLLMPSIKEAIEKKEKN
ncbi:MAG: sigma-54-dependent Fis family transcriptional regulator, partial [Nitrospirae bacterium]|nr:sigma-54-dependent Fis family transcriptional regulator [Nitrospirota bacterium]